ncbi:MAG: FAD-dependent oxidoreductase [Brevundimonas sp.]|nr:FAD-dependent oxidoreductase [Brevundimonas sp.]
MIIGGGVLGLCTAAVLARRGHAVTLVDPGGPNASSVAAGMIAPAMEAAVEAVDPARAELFRAAAALWPAFAVEQGISLVEADAEWRGEGAEVIARRLKALGFTAEITATGVRAPQDMRLSPEAAMARLGRPLKRIEGRVARIAPDGDGWRMELDDGRGLRTDGLVLALGVGAPPEGLPAGARAAVEAVRPVRGQIGRIAEALSDRTLRGSGGYVTPVDGGVVLGATMEEGRRDLTPDPDVAERLRRAGETLLGRPLDPSVIDWRVGVRGASPDGLPLTGLVAPGLAAALAPRRNGWLMGPLVGTVVADALEGRAPREAAAALDPLRI